MRVDPGEGPQAGGRGVGQRQGTRLIAPVPLHLHRIHALEGETEPSSTAGGALVLEVLRPPNTGVVLVEGENVLVRRPGGGVLRDLGLDREFDRAGIAGGPVQLLVSAVLIDGGGDVRAGGVPHQLKNGEQIGLAGAVGTGKDGEGPELDLDIDEGSVVLRLDRAQRRPRLPSAHGRTLPGAPEIP